MHESLIIRFFYRLSSILEPYGRAILAVSFVLICVSGYKFYSQEIDLSASSLIPDSSPELVRISNFMDINPNSRVTIVEFHSTSPDDVDIMREVAGKIEAALSEYIEESHSIGMPKAEKLVAMLPYLFDEEAEAKIAARATPEVILESIAGIRQAMLGLYGFAPKEFLRADPLGWLNVFGDKISDELFSGSSLNPTNLYTYPVSPDGHYVMLLLRPKGGLYNVESARDITVITQEKLAELLAPYGGRIEGKLVGGMRYTADNAVTIERDLKLTVSLSLLFLAIIYSFTVRSLGSIWLLLTPVVAVIFAGSSMSFFWPTTAGLALAFGAAVLAISVDFAVLVHFALRRNRNSISRPAVIASVSRPMMFSASLCIASFCVLMFSSLPTMRQLGFFAAASLVAGLVIATMMLPYCPWMDKPRLQPLQRSADETRLRPKPAVVLSLFLLMVCICVWGFSEVKFDTSVGRLGTNTDAIWEEAEEMRARWKMGKEPHFWLNSASSQDKALADSALLNKTIRERGGLSFSMADLLPASAAQRENLARWGEFVIAHGEEIQASLLTASEAAGFKSSAFRWFNDWLVGQRHEAQAGRLIYTPNALRGLIEESGLGDLFWWLTAEGKGEQYIFTYSNITLEKTDLPEQIRDNALLFSLTDLTEGIAEVFQGDIRLLPLAGLVCMVLLAFCFRRPLWVLLASLPPLFGLCSILLWQIFTGNDLTLAGVAGLTMIIGLGADYGIVMLHELSSRISFGAFRSILVSGLTTLSGLGVLILAKHPVLNELGVITFFGMSAELLGVLILVPLLCRKKGQCRG